MKRENRYIVLKRKDVLSYLDESEWATLNTLLAKLSYRRRSDNRGDIECVVVEHDWPEYETVWKMIEDRVYKESSNDKE